MFETKTKKKEKIQCKRTIDHLFLQKGGQKERIGQSIRILCSKSNHFCCQFVRSYFQEYNELVKCHVTFQQRTRSLRFKKITNHQIQTRQEEREDENLNIEVKLKEDTCIKLSMRQERILRNNKQIRTDMYCAINNAY